MHKKLAVPQDAWQDYKASILSINYLWRVKKLYNWEGRASFLKSILSKYLELILQENQINTINIVEALILLLTSDAVKSILIRTNGSEIEMDIDRVINSLRGKIAFAMQDGINIPIPESIFGAKRKK